MIRKVTFGFIGFITILSLAIALFMQQNSFGKLPSGAALDRIKISKQYKNGSFENIERTVVMAEGASYFELASKFFSKGVNREPSRPLPSVKTDLKSTASPSIVWFGHSSFLINVGGKKILCDPVFSERASPVQWAGSASYPGTRVFQPKDFPDLDIIIISHDHYDHLDYNTVLELKDRTHLFCVPLGVGEHLKHWGVPAEKIKEFDWWEGERLSDGIEITCTPARHFSGRGFKRNKTLWASFVLKANEYNIFIGGDSGYDGAFKKIGDAFGPFDIAMLECGQYDAQWPEIHMMPEQTVQASIDLKAKVLLPVHWAKFTLGLHPWKDPIERATKHADSLGVAVTTPMIGEPIILTNPYPSQQWWEDY